MSTSHQFLFCFSRLLQFLHTMISILIHGFRFKVHIGSDFWLFNREMTGIRQLPLIIIFYSCLLWVMILHHCAMLLLPVLPANLNKMFLLLSAQIFLALYFFLVICKKFIHVFKLFFIFLRKENLKNNNMILSKYINF